MRVDFWWAARFTVGTDNAPTLETDAALTTVRTLWGLVAGLGDAEGAILDVDCALEAQDDLLSAFAADGLQAFTSGVEREGAVPGLDWQLSVMDEMLQRVPRL